MSGQRETLSYVTPEILLIYSKNKRRKNTDTSIIRKQPIKEPINPSKKVKEINLTHVEKGSPKEMPPSFWNKVD